MEENGREVIDVGDVGDQAGLRKLRTRAAETGLSVQDSERHGTLVQMAAEAHAGKRARRAIAQ
eukprot:6399807-Pyramimonas_sp.AAC.1